MFKDFNYVAFCHIPFTFLVTVLVFLGEKLDKSTCDKQLKKVQVENPDVLKITMFKHHLLEI